MNFFFLFLFLQLEVFPSEVASMVKNLLTVLETGVQLLDWEHPLEQEMATQSNILVGRIPWTEESGGLQSTRSQRVNTRLNN